MKVLGKISGRDKSLSAICIRGSGDCPFCRSMNSQFQNKDDSIPKLFHKGNNVDSFGFRGCEQNNLIIHLYFFFQGPLLRATEEYSTRRVLSQAITCRAAHEQVRNVSRMPQSDGHAGFGALPSSRWISLGLSLSAPPSPVRSFFFV